MGSFTSDTKGNKFFSKGGLSLDFINIFYYFFFIFFFTMLFSGYGSVLERLKSHSNDYGSYLFAFIVSSLTIYFTNASFRAKIKYDPVNYTIARSTRLRYAICGTISLLIGIVQLICNIIPYSPSSRLYAYASSGLISYGTMLWFLALYDSTEKKINFKILKKTDVEQELHIKQKCHFDKKHKNRIYFWLSIGTICYIVSGLIQIFKTNNQKEGIYHIIYGLSIATFFVFLFEYIVKKHHEDNKNDFEKKEEESS